MLVLWCPLSGTRKDIIVKDRFVILILKFMGLVYTVALEYMFWASFYKSNKSIGNFFSHIYVFSQTLGENLKMFLHFGDVSRNTSILRYI